MVRIDQSAVRPFRLISASATKRWGRWFAFAFIAMWLSTALLPCCEVAAAVAAHEQIAHAGCGHDDDGAPGPGGTSQHPRCFDFSAPAPSSSPDSFAAGSVALQFAAAVPAPFYTVPTVGELSLPVAYRAAPPPEGVFSRSLRLLI